MDCFRRISSVIIFLSFHMLHLVCGTTVGSLCKPGDPAGNCTTEIMKTTASPQMSSLKVSKCAPEMSNYCINGQCLYHEEADEHYCQCERGYLGLRCAHSDLPVQRPPNEEYLALTIFLTSMLLIVAALAVFFALKWYRLKKSIQSVQKYKEVNTQHI